MKFFSFSKVLITVFAIIILSLDWYFSFKTYAIFAVNKYMEAQGVKQKDILKNKRLDSA